MHEASAITGRQTRLAVRLRRAAAFVLLLLVWSSSSFGGAVPAATALSGLPPGFVEDLPIVGFSQPIGFDWTPDGRIFVGEKAGALRVVKDGALLPTPALTLAVSSQSERGLLGVVFDPRFATRPYVYLYYTTGPGSRSYTGQPRNRVSRFTVSGDGVALDSELILVDDIPSDTGTHNAGDLHFGPDGLLYISTGDGGNAANGWSQSLESLGGKILRVDPDTGAGVSDNPFRDNPNANARRIWAYGFRNPFRFAIQPGSGALQIADVGQNRFEELDLGVPGANYGWPEVEGPEPPGRAGRTYPIFWYEHRQPTGIFQGCSSITGGPFVTGSNFPASYAGNTIFADYACQRIFRFEPATGGGSPTVTIFAGAVGTSDAGRPVHLAFGPEGHLYYSDIANGHLRRIRYTADSNRPPTARSSASPLTGPLPLAVDFSSAGSGDPDEEAVSYLWSFGDGGTSTLPNPRHTYTVAGMHQVGLTVTDSRGASTSAPPLTIRAGNNPPRATIAQPADGTRVRVGGTIAFQGSGTDAEDGPLPGPQLSWEIVRQHGTSPPRPWDSGTGPTLTTTMPPPEDLVNAGASFLVARLTVTDSGGAADTRSIRVYPEAVPLRFQTEPPGLFLVLDGISTATPADVVSSPGWAFGVGAVSQVGGDGRIYDLVGWSDGGAPSHQLVTPEVPTTITATFRARETAAEPPRPSPPLPPASGPPGTNPRTPVPACFGRPATIVGTPGDDVLSGTPGPDVIVGLGGNDTIRGGGGGDVICGGPGNDRLFGGTGNDLIGGGDGADLLDGGPDNDVLDGGPGADRLQGQAGDDRLHGAAGDDVLVGGAGADRLLGGAGNDRLLGGLASDQLVGGPGNDRLFGDAGNDQLVGEAGNDLLSGGVGRDVMLGGPGRDTCAGGPDADLDAASGCEVRIAVP